MILALFLMLCALNAIDAVQTIKALQGQGFSEMNPVGRFLFATFGLVPGVLLFKAVILTIVGLVSFLMPEAYGLAINLPLIGWGLFTAIHNYREMRK